MTTDLTRGERYRAFLNREPMGRPLLGCSFGKYMPQAFPNLCRSLPPGPLSPEDIRTDLFLEDCERLYRQYVELDDDYPFVGTPFMYVPWMEAIMGCPIRVMETSMVAEPVIEEWDNWNWEAPLLDRNPWGRKLLELMQALVKHSAGRYPLTHTLMRGPADILSAMRGASQFPLDFYDNPQLVHKALALLAKVWVEVAEAQLALIPDSADGYIGAGSFRVWSPDRIIWLQEDACALLSPSFYRDFVLPQDRLILRQFPYSAFHLHGSALWSIGDLISTPQLNFIEVNHESAHHDVDATFMACRQVQRSKSLVLWKEFDGPQFWPWLDRVMTELSPYGLSLTIALSTLEEAQGVKSKVMAAA